MDTNARLVVAPGSTKSDFFKSKSVDNLVIDLFMLSISERGKFKSEESLPSLNKNVIRREIDRRMGNNDVNGKDVDILRYQGVIYGDKFYPIYGDREPIPIDSIIAFESEYDDYIAKIESEKRKQLKTKALQKVANILSREEMELLGLYEHHN
jgi:hypothetical protein